MSIAPFFEHIALAVHLDDLLAWDRYLRGPLGGRACMGGIEPRAGFQGGQIAYPDGGMLELITWTRGGEAKSPNARYLARHHARAALHHLTFLVEDFDAALAHGRSGGFAPMVGRQGRNWKEFFVKEATLRPAGLLIQVLCADKDALAKQGWRQDWEPFATQQPEPPELPVRIEGVHLATSDAAPAARLFRELLLAETDGDALGWPGSSMRVWLHDGADDDASHVQISAEPDAAPPEAPALFRTG